MNGFPIIISYSKIMLNYMKVISIIQELENTLEE